jgi:hypothetical protein
MNRLFLFRSIVLALVTALVVGSSAVAQISAPPEGITVLGRGEASAPADSTMFRISLSNPMFGAMPVGGSQPFTTPEAGNGGQTGPIADALVEVGIPESDMTVVMPPYLGNNQFGPYGPALAMVEFTITDPSANRIREIVDAANAGAAESQLIVSDILLVHEIQDCSALYDEAVAAAFDDAQSRATRQADILGLTIGDVVASRDSGLLLSPDPSSGIAADGTCTYIPANAITYGPFGPTPYNIVSDPEVRITAGLEVTFEIVEGASATPAA